MMQAKPYYVLMKALGSELGANRHRRLPRHLHDMDINVRCWQICSCPYS
jgi:hypothetical protein